MCMHACIYVDMHLYAQKRAHIWSRRLTLDAFPSTFPVTEPGTHVFDKAGQPRSHLDLQLSLLLGADTLLFGLVLQALALILMP